MIKSTNLFDLGALPSQGERFDEVLRHRNLLIERIVSSSRISPQIYVQAQDEWVMLLSGEASMRVCGELLALKAGDHLFLPAGTPHSVETASQGATWLAVHLHPDEIQAKTPHTS
jgi:cupin 2 domain-containing protein